MFIIKMHKNQPEAEDEATGKPKPHPNIELVHNPANAK